MTPLSSSVIPEHLQRFFRPVTIRQKSLIGIPWRYALRCIDDLGLILRAEVIWSKPNGLPESVTDRVRRSHEQWFHFVQQPRYFSAVDEIREAHDPASQAHVSRYAGREYGKTNTARGDAGASNFVGNALGKLPGSVWTINGGETLARSVLNAVAAQAITPDEGERILLWTRHDSGALWTWPASAGNGSDCSTPTDTAGITHSASELDEPTGSPTRSASDPSPKDSRSTTSAATNDASDPTTSSPSLPASTSSVDHSPTSASTGTSSPTRTLTSAQEAAESAAHVCGTGCANGEHASGPPSTWVVPTQPLTVPAHLGVDHFAAFPMEWPRRIIQGWAPTRGVCTACGEGRRPVAEFTPEYAANRGPGTDWNSALRSQNGGYDGSGNRRVGGAGPVSSARQITGHACACPEPTAPTTPAVVLDIFGGTGTTALVAKVNGCHGISVDMSADYCRLAEWRTNDPSEIARAMQVDKPAEQVAGQADLFDLIREASA